MKNITLAIDEEVLERARLVAAEQKTTINAMVREFLVDVAGRDERLAEGAGGAARTDAKFERQDAARLQVQPRGEP